MNNRITDHQIIERLEENGLRYGVLALQDDVTMSVSERGGRVFGPFLKQDSESIFWVNGAFAQPDSFQAFLNRGDWNLGGERIWIAPEIQYLVRDRANFWGSIQVPAQMDPGQYTLDQPRPGQWRLCQNMSLTAHNLASGQKELHLEMLIRQVEDPLRNLNNYHSLLDGVVFAGYEQVVSLSESKLDSIMSEAWNLIQLNPGGVLLVPASPRVEVTNYMEPVDEDFQTIHSNYVSLKITGNRRYKVGYKAAHVTGHLAYFNRLDDNRAYLIVRNYFNNPSAPYIEEWAQAPGRRGDSVHVYNDDGGLGGFGELESHGQTIGGVTGRSSSTEQMVLWLYIGASSNLKEIALHLLGINL